MEYLKKRTLAVKLEYGDQNASAPKRRKAKLHCWIFKMKIIQVYSDAQTQTQTDTWSVCVCVHVHNASAIRTHTGVKRTNLIKFFHFVHESRCCIRISLLANAITYSLVSLHFSVGSLLYLPDCVPVSPIPYHSLDIYSFWIFFFIVV